MQISGRFSNGLLPAQGSLWMDMLNIWHKSTLGSGYSADLLFYPSDSTFSAVLYCFFIHMKETIWKHLDCIDCQCIFANLSDAAVMHRAKKIMCLLRRCDSMTRCLPFLEVWNFWDAPWQNEKITGNIQIIEHKTMLLRLQTVKTWTPISAIAWTSAWHHIALVFFIV